MKLVSFFYVGLSALIISTPFYVFKGAIACEMTDQLGFKEIRQNIFVSSNSLITIEDVGFISAGIERVNNTFGPTIADPVWILTDTKAESDFFFASETATSHFSPFSNCLVLGPKGQNVDVSAHEFVHVEINVRLGWLNQILKMPRWFEEGVSLIVDMRDPFVLENIKLEKAEVELVKNYFYGYQFYTEDEFTNYQAARLAVDSLDAKQFYSNLVELKTGKDFTDVFSR